MSERQDIVEYLRSWSTGLKKAPTPEGRRQFGEIGIERGQQPAGRFPVAMMDRWHPAQADQPAIRPLSVATMPSAAL